MRLCISCLLLCKMYGKLFLLAVVCVSFVQVRGDVNLGKLFGKDFGPVMNTKENVIMDVLKGGFAEEEMSKEDAIKEAISFCDEMLTVSIDVFGREMRVWDDIRRIIGANLTEYTERQTKEEERIRKALGKMAENIKEEARDLGKPTFVLHCIEKAEADANKQIHSLGKQIVAQLLMQYIEYNISYPEVPSTILEEMLKIYHSEAVEEITNSNSTESVWDTLSSYMEYMYDNYDSVMEHTKEIKTFFIRHQLLHRVLPKMMNKEMERIRSKSYTNMRKCLNTRNALFGNFLPLNMLE